MHYSPRYGKLTAACTAIHVSVAFEEVLVKLDTLITGSLGG